MLYNLLRPLLFQLDAETAHTVTLDTLALLQKTNVWPKRTFHCPTNHIMGLDFPNPIGLAAGLDKNGAYINALAQLGFGFIEVGTITPRSQPGNPQPRLFRLPAAQAIINRMGFNNIGVDKLIENIQQAHYPGILGINIGKNADTPLQNAVDDYLICLRKVYPYASYITVNISSPNTKQLRQLQNKAALEQLLRALKQAQTRLSDQHSHYVPLAIKIAPDLESAQIKEIAALLLKHRIDAVIATNTTVARNGVTQLPHGNESGGLSGAPLTERSTEVIYQLARQLQRAIPIIGAGGIMSATDAQTKIEAGASLVQIYSGLIYRGPSLISEIAALLCSQPTHAG